MFDISFAELVVLITGASFLLGKREIVASARVVGRGLGKIVGTMQGVRIKFEEKSRGTQFFDLHSSIKRGLRDVSTIGSDLVSVGVGDSGAQITTNGTMPTPSHVQSTTVSNSTEPTPNRPSTSSEKDFVRISKLSRLILVDEKLEKTDIRHGAPVDGADIIKAVISASTLNSLYSHNMLHLRVEPGKPQDSQIKSRT